MSYKILGHSLKTDVINFQFKIPRKKVISFILIYIEHKRLY